MSERRYREDEVKRIFELATSNPVVGAPARTDTDGLTLADIQSIGQEVGLEPAVLARAAAALDARAVRSKRQTTLGMPIEAGRIVSLPRALTDHEWEQLVADLRTTFRARGKVTTQGSLREWSNGNLHASIEPTESGHRLRLGTFKGDARGLNALGAVGIAGSAVLFGALAMSGELAQGFFLPWAIGASGLGAIIANWVRLPRWAREREQQMEHIAGRIASIMGTSTGTTGTTSTSTSTEERND